MEPIRLQNKQIYDSTTYMMDIGQHEYKIRANETTE